MTIRNKLRAFITHWLPPTPKEAAKVLSDHAVRLKTAYDRLRAERAAGWPQ